MENFMSVIAWFGNFFKSWFFIANNNFALSLGEFLFVFSTFFSILAIYFKGSGRD